MRHERLDQTIGSNGFLLSEAVYRSRESRYFDCENSAFACDLIARAA